MLEHVLDVVLKGIRIFKESVFSSEEMPERDISKSIISVDLVLRLYFKLQNPAAVKREMCEAEYTFAYRIIQSWSYFPKV